MQLQAGNTEWGHTPSTSGGGGWGVPVEWEAGDAKRSRAAGVAQR